MTIKDLKKALEENKIPTVTETFEQVIDTVEKVNQLEDKKIDYKKAFEQQQAVLIEFIKDTMENEIEYPEFKSNMEKWNWYQKRLLVNKYDFNEIKKI